MEAVGVAPPVRDREIARATSARPIREIAQALGVLDDEFEPYGKYVGKIHAPAILQRMEAHPNGRYIVVTGITPTPLGEGKTVTTVGLSMAISRLGRRAIGSLRHHRWAPSSARRAAPVAAGIARYFQGRL